MRLFTGIELGDTAREKAANVAAQLRRRIEQEAPQARLTWIPAERLHVTLQFIGEVDDPLAERIIGALRDPVPMAPFTIAFDGLGAFHPKGPPRAIWIGVVEEREAVVRAESMIGDRLTELGIPREDRPYSPHLTLARVRDARGLRVPRLVEGVSSSLGRTPVAAITLFQSKLSPKGPTYVVLERTALRAG